MKEVDLKNSITESVEANVSELKANDEQGSFDHLDPSKNGVLGALNRIEKNTAGFEKNQAREATANIRSLRRARASNPRMKVIPGSTIPIPAPPTPAESKASKEATKPPKQIDNASDAIDRSKQAAEDYAKREAAEAKEAANVRDSKGRFLPKDGSAKGGEGESENKGEQALKDRKEEEQSKGLLGAIKESFTGDSGIFSSNESSDDVGVAAGGPIYSSYKEMSEAYKKLSSEDSPASKAMEAIKGKFSKPESEESQPESSTSSNTKDSESIKEVVEQNSESSKVVESISENAVDTAEGIEDVKDGVEAQTKEQKKQHKVTTKILNRIRMSSNQGGGGSLLDMLGGRGRRGGARGRARGRIPTGGTMSTAAKTATAGGKGGGFFSRAGASIASKGGGLARGAASFGSKALGAAAAPIAGMFAYGSKKSELEGREDLTESQKTTQAAATGIGAGGGALAGAALAVAVLY